MDLALNNLERLICQKAQPTNQPIKNSRFLGAVEFSTFYEKQNIQRIYSYIYFI